MDKSKNFRKGISFKLLSAVMALSIAGTLVATGIRSYQSYQGHIHKLDEQMKDIEKSYVPAMIKSLWEMDTEHIQIQLEGILRLPYMQYAAVISEEKKIISSAGRPKMSDRIIRTFDLSYIYSGREVGLGSFEIIADIGPIRALVWKELYSTLLMEGLKILVLFLFILFIIHILITRHLQTMAAYTRQLNIRTNYTPLVLHRRTSGNADKDELDEVASALNDVLKNLKESFEQLTQNNMLLEKEITEHKRAEEENRTLAERLQRAEKMEALGQLAGGVAHDLNNVLGILSGYSELLLQQIPEGHRSRRHAEKILQSTEKGAAIIEDLLTLARRGVATSEVINLNSIVTGFLKSSVFEKMKERHPRVAFKAECDQNLLNIKGSPVHLEKTLMNLASNAAESTSGTGEVTIRTESRYLDRAVRGYDDVREGDYAILTVSDTGMGIPAESREKIFEPFYTKKTMGRSGTGLGLAIVWGTVKDHNGYIDLQTEVGRGSTFTLYFPVTREELIVLQQKAPIEGYMGTGESVLVVDDIAEQRDVAVRLITRLGYEVEAVSSGEDALEYLRGHKADILVLDMIMAPGIDGLETYRRVLAINPGQKAILVSGFSETDRVREAQRLGAGAYVKKPYLMEKIGAAVRSELDRR
jgi:signal transduction histidine kinase